MANAVSIFLTHKQRRQNKINQIEQDIGTEQRLHTTAINAAGHAKETGEKRDMEEYLRQADAASDRLAELRTELETALEPIPLQEGLAAWEENSSTLVHNLRIRLQDYLEACNDAAEALILLLDLYERLQKEKMQYAEACCAKEEDFQSVLAQFKAYSLDATRMRRSINFYSQFKAMTLEEAEQYKRLL